MKLSNLGQADVGQSAIIATALARNRDTVDLGDGKANVLPLVLVGISVAIVYTMFTSSNS